MKTLISPRTFAVLAALLLATGCAKRAENLAALSADELYQRAAAAYEERNLDRAIRLYDAFVQAHLGDPRAPEARLMLGRAHEQKREHVTAIAHYQRLVNDFPSSPLQLDARFGICKAYYDLSPKPALDQEYTRSAMLHCESIGQYYPGTEQATQATGYVDDLRTKLARKAYETGLFYFKRRAYDAAVVYFEDVADNYPRTEVAPAALRQLVETYNLIGYVEEAQAARERLLQDYPDSPEARALRA